MSFHISDKVVCVDDVMSEFDRGCIYPNGYLQKDQVYVISDIDVMCYPPPSEVCFRIVGVPGFDPEDGLEVYHEASRFRKLSDVKAENSTKRKEKAKP